MTRPLIVGHAHCIDGFTAVWVVDRALRALGLDPEVLFAQYGDVPPDVTDRDFYIVDFHYPRPVLEVLAKQARSIWVGDHHKTAKEALEGLPYCTFDMRESGASLAWDKFHPKEDEPALIRYTRDYDLWRHKLPYTKEVNAYIASRSRQFHVWDDLHEMIESEEGLVAAMNMGKTILELEDQYVQSQLRFARKVTFENVPMLAVNSTHLRSKLGDELAKETGAGLVWFLREDGKVQWSLRSTRESGIDVSKIAEKHGGGGHATAAGIVFTWYEHAHYWPKIQDEP